MEMAKTLYEPTRSQEDKMKWTPEMGMAFKTPRRALLEAPALALLDIHSQTFLSVYVSGKGVSKVGTHLSFGSMEKPCGLFI